MFSYKRHNNVKPNIMARMCIFISYISKSGDQVFHSIFCFNAKCGANIENVGIKKPRVYRGYYNFNSDYFFPAGAAPFAGAAAGAAGAPPAGAAAGAPPATGAADSSCLNARVVTTDAIGIRGEFRIS